MSIPCQDVPWTALRRSLLINIRSIAPHKGQHVSGGWIVAHPVLVKEGHWISEQFNSCLPPKMENKIL